MLLPIPRNSDGGALMWLIYCAAVAVGVYFLYLAVWYQLHMDAIVGIPFVLG